MALENVQIGIVVLTCGCRPGDGVMCAAADQLMEQAHAMLRRPAARDNWADYERAKTWLARHYDENKFPELVE